jgi:hexosaminidase
MIISHCFLILSAFISLISPIHALWPKPRNLQTGGTPLRLSPSFDIVLSVSDAPQDLRDAVTRTISFLHTDQLARLVVGRGVEDVMNVSKALELSKLTVQLTTQGKANTVASEAQKSLKDRNEAYTLHVPTDGSAATLAANSTLGLFRGLTTFTQLWYTFENATYTIEAPITIDDAPIYVSPRLSSVIRRSKIVILTYSV